MGANEINDGIYGPLQEILNAKLKGSDIHPSIEYVEHAQLAVGTESSTLRFRKFATPGPLFDLYKNQKKVPNSMVLVDRCIVEKLNTDSDGKKVATIQTSRGPLQVKNAKIILCMGTIPPTTLLLNSFPEKVPNAGRRLSGHFVTHITARVPKEDFSIQFAGLQIAASYVAGAHGDKQYHIQITGTFY